MEPLTYQVNYEEEYQWLKDANKILKDRLRLAEEANIALTKENINLRRRLGSAELNQPYETPYEPRYPEEVYRD